ncbi:MAG: GH3 auxin-responsive promoter family protein [Bacteroidota bacterium]
MEIVNSVLTWLMKKRIHQIELFLKYPHDVQLDVFHTLIKTARDTSFGRKYGFQDISRVKQFQEQVPIASYEEFFPHIDRLLHGEDNVLWPGKIKWFAKSSGTTNATSKFIPVSQEALDECHYKGGKDLVSIYVNNYPNTKMFAGKTLAIGGSQQINQLDENSESYTGDVSAVLMKNLPFWAQFSRTPSLDIALMDDWEAKVERIVRSTVNENVTAMAGVPTWIIVILQRILELKKAQHIHEIWPHLEVFFHGAVSFTPYRDLFQKLIPSDKMYYTETYNATEGFFGIQDQRNSTEMLLMLDYGIFYEFIPMDEFDQDQPRTLTIDEVEVGKNYALVISTNAGLWRYKIGDTIRFTSTSPYRFRITGRTKHFINAFGEELVIENAEGALAEACRQSNALIENFTAAPQYIDEGKKGRHEWIIEFSQPPELLEQFTLVLDETLQKLNSDYRAKREKSLAVDAPLVHAAPKGTFYRWMKSRGKLGGQNKVPRLANNREYLEDILANHMAGASAS